MTPRIDLEADLNAEDDEGRWWSVLDWALDPEAVVPGAVLVAGRREPSVAEPVAHRLQRYALVEQHGHHHEDQRRATRLTDHLECHAARCVRGAWRGEGAFPTGGALSARGALSVRARAPCLVATPARAQWNTIPVQQSALHIPAFGDTRLWLTGLDSGLAVGDLVLIVGAEQAGDPAAERWDVRVITGIALDTDRRLTEVRWQTGLGHSRPFVLPASESVRIFTFHSRAAAFGASAPDWRDTKRPTVSTRRRRRGSWRP